LQKEEEEGRERFDDSVFDRIFLLAKGLREEEERRNFDGD